jgi:hypothetical protein
MRIGINKSKEELIQTQQVVHRVVFPLYIPHQNDYYKQAFDVFELCLNSLHKTVSTPLKVSVVSNNSCHEVNQKLQQFVAEKKIDQLIIETEAIGKINSIYKVLKTANEPFITISDADVLFCNNWDKEVFNVFESFPKAGAVCPVPVYRTHLQLTSNIWFDYLFSNKLSFQKVKNPIALEKFALSIGKTNLPETHKDIIGTIKAKNNTIAVLGCSHFVATYKREVFEAAPKKESKFVLGGTSELDYLDIPVLMQDGYRLATYDNFAFHMGNTLEEWMNEHYQVLKQEEKVFRNISSRKLKNNKLIYFLKNKFFKKLFYNKYFYKKMLQFKGVPKSKINNFFN